MKPKTISYEAARQAMLDAAKPLGTETIDIGDSLGRVLAEDVQSDIDMPPFDKSAMDGYACRRADLSGELTVVETIPAGVMPEKTIGPGECSKIMTGAPVPDGADCVIMVEFTEGDDSSIRFSGDDTRDNICRCGEDTKIGDTVLSAGGIIGPADIAVLASVGCVRPTVYLRPRVAVMATGSELVEPAAQPTGAQIRNSNSFQLCAQFRAMGIEADYLGVVPDTYEETSTAVKRGVADYDLLLFSGGVSMGDYDFVPRALRENGFHFDFESVAMKPGRPTVFGRADTTFCCGLPGNPVSTFVVFEILLQPFLYGLMGHAWAPRLTAATLGKEIRRRKTKRQSTVPVVFTSPGTVEALEYHGSAHIHAMTMAHGMLTIPAGQDRIEAGSTVHVRPL